MRFKDKKKFLFEFFKNNPDSAVAFRYKGEPMFDSQTHHVFIVLFWNKDDGVINLVHGTSKIKKTHKRINSQNINSKKTTVEIPARKYKFFPKNTIFNCNSIDSVMLDDLQMDRWEHIHDGFIKCEDFRLIAQAISESPRVDGYIKDYLSRVITDSN